MCDNVAAQGATPVCYLADRRVICRPYRPPLDGPFRRAKNGPPQTRRPGCEPLATIFRLQRFNLSARVSSAISSYISTAFGILSKGQPEPPLSRWHHTVTLPHSCCLNQFTY